MRHKNAGKLEYTAFDIAIKSKKACDMAQLCLLHSEIKGLVGCRRIGEVLLKRIIKPDECIH